MSWGSEKASLPEGESGRYYTSLLCLNIELLTIDCKLCVLDIPGGIQKV